MHFSKTYSQLLLTLPPELQKNAIEYRQLKKLINKVVLELSSLGLSPSVLHGLLHAEDPVATSQDKGKGRELDGSDGEGEETAEPTIAHAQVNESRPKAVYELTKDGDRIEPRLRLWLASSEPTASSSKHAHIVEAGNENDSETHPRVAVFLDSPEQQGSPASGTAELVNDEDNTVEVPAKDLVMVSQPLDQNPKESLVWSLQRRSHESVERSADASGSGWDSTNSVDSNSAQPHISSLPAALENRDMQISADGTQELVIPLASDTAFFQLLYTALESLAKHLHDVRSKFIVNLEELARSISHTARPKSATSRDFRPWSSSSDPSNVTSPLISPFSRAFVPGGKSKSDLYAWREIFQLYIESEVFESTSERDRGERDIEEAEKRLALFAERVTGRGLSDSRKLHLKASQDALETFLQLNVLILNLKKFQHANAEAARKILKKHAKRTALPLPSGQLEVKTFFLFPRPSLDAGQALASTTPSTLTESNVAALIPSTASSLPHILVQAIGETLLPIIPHIDDYECLICTSIAFKPIRLACGHLFCVRCLVKMQKRGQDHCPCCRAPVVLKADRTNVDWAMLNFMQDWFPRESQLKLKQNEMESTKEQMEELGFNDQPCRVM